MGEQSLLDVVNGALELGIPWISAYAFSLRIGSAHRKKCASSPDSTAMSFTVDLMSSMQFGVRVRWAGRHRRLWQRRQ